MAFLGYTQQGEQTLGNRLGGDIGEIIQGLAQKKLEHQRYKQKQQFLHGLGIHPSVAAGLAHQDDKFIADLLKPYNFSQGLSYGNQAQQNPQGYQQALEGLIGNTDQNQALQAQYNNQQQSPEIQNLVRGMYAQDPGLEQRVSPEQLGSMIAQQMQRQPQQYNTPTRSGIATHADLAKNNDLRKEAYKAQLAEDKIAKKESKEFLNQLNKDAKVSKDNDMRLDRMQELIDTGKLSSPLFHNFLNTLAHGLWGVGLDLHFLESPESQEFSKISNDFIKGVKDVFGARVTDLDLKSYLKTIPTLSQTNEGKERIIRNLKISNQANKIKEKVAKSIIRANGNQIPADLALIVDEAVSPKLDELSKRFVTNMKPKNKVTKSQEPIDTIFNATGLNKLSLFD